MRKPLDWNDLRYLLAIARHGRLLAAAKALRVRHTTVARRLAALEHSVGVPVFFRTARGHVLTDEGRRLLAVAEQMERAALTVATRLPSEKGMTSGRIRIACIESWAAIWLTPRLPQLLARHPKLQVEIRGGQGRADLARGEAEIALRSPAPTEPDLVGRRLGECSLGLYGTASLAERYRADLDDEGAPAGIPLCLYTSEFELLQSAGWLDRVRATARVVLETNSTFTLLAAGEAGLGIIVAPRFLARESRVLVPAATRDVTRQPIHVVTHVEFKKDPRVRAVLEFLSAHAHTLADS